MKKIIVTMALAMVMAIGIDVGNAGMMNGQHMMANGQQGTINQQPCMMMGNGMGMMGPGMMNNMMMGRGMGMMNGGMMGGMGMMGSGMDMRQYRKTMDDTREIRRRLHDMKFEYGEAMRNPKTTIGDLQRMREKMNSLQQKIMQKMQPQNN